MYIEDDLLNWQEPTDEGEAATVEALRAIAEQLYEINQRLEALVSVVARER